MGSSWRRTCLHGIWILHHLPSRPELPHRHFPEILGKRRGGQYLFEIHLRSGFSFVCDSYVSQTRYSVGEQSSRFHCNCFAAHPLFVLYLRAKDKKERQVHLGGHVRSGLLIANNKSQIKGEIQGRLDISMRCICTLLFEISLVT